MHTLNFKGDVTWKGPGMRTEWRCLKKVNIELPYDPAGPLLDYNLTENWKDTGRQICIAQYDNSQDMEVAKKSTKR